MAGTDRSHADFVASAEKALGFGARRRGPFPSRDIPPTTFRIRLGVRKRRLSSIASLQRKDPFQKGSTPPAAGSRAAAFAKLRGAPRPLDANELNQLPFAHVKAKANFFVQFHGYAFRVQTCLSTPIRSRPRYFASGIGGNQAPGPITRVP